MASVRGIGVAVMTRQCGVVCLRSWARCSTPNLCCSSIMTKPSCWNSISACNNATVPTTISIPPEWMAFRVSTLFLPNNPPVIITRLTLLFLRYLSILRKCWAARISVGAMITTCILLATASSAAYNATTVLPEPTSPCKSRFIGSDLPISVTISEIQTS